MLVNVSVKIHALLFLELAVALCHPLNSSLTLLSLRCSL